MEIRRRKEMGELSRDVPSELGFDRCIGVQQIMLKLGYSSMGELQEQSLASDSEEARRTGGWVLTVTYSFSIGATYLSFRRGKSCLFPQSGFLGLFLSLSDQLLNEAPWDDREKGRGRGRWRALVLFPNLFGRSKE